MIQPLLFLFMFLAGAGLTVQFGMNATLRTAFGDASAATLANFVVGLVGLGVLMLVTRSGLPDRAALAAAPAWAWFGGLLGAVYVALSSIAGPRVGASTLLAVTLLGQLVASLVVDHFGLVGFLRHPISAGRLIGALLLFVGVWLVSRH